MRTSWQQLFFGVSYCVMLLLLRFNIERHCLESSVGHICSEPTYLTRSPTVHWPTQVQETTFTVGFPGGGYWVLPKTSWDNIQPDYCNFGVILIIKEWILLSHFLTGVGSGLCSLWQYKWIPSSPHDQLWGVELMFKLKEHVSANNSSCLLRFLRNFSIIFHFIRY